jgi:hypothetical protein
MKMTLEIDDALLAQVQALAARENVAVSAFVERALRDRVRVTAAGERDVARASALAEARPIRIYSAGKGGMHPWNDPCSNESMLDAMDGFDDP